uniref:B-like cyclin n=1 Tax=Erythroxylum novogranatense TaxID=1862640 RepID=A0AAV8T8P6_9ROSI|nr:hypothetical protein K2173_008074 [Erythroxylum novogranatense]
MRGILVDWLVAVAEECKLVCDTLYLTVNYIDRFLPLKALNKEKLQLLGIASMFIAFFCPVIAMSRKYKEITPPKVEDLWCLTDNTYTKHEVVKMESDILNTLKFELDNPTVKTFLISFIQLSGDLQGLHRRIANRDKLAGLCVKILPSLVAASVIFVRRYILRPKKHPWNAILQQHTRYKPGDLEDCVLIIHDLHLSGLHAVREKYKQHKCAFTTEIPAAAFEDVRE